MRLLPRRRRRLPAAPGRHRLDPAPVVPAPAAAGTDVPAARAPDDTGERADPTDLTGPRLVLGFVDGSRTVLPAAGLVEVDSLLAAVQRTDGRAVHSCG